jgi:enamine deaminase RidA (YjgF/YER057c/UK114 family)
VKATVFLADMNDYNTMNELYRRSSKAIRRRARPCRSQLPRDARIEIEVSRC